MPVVEVHLVEGLHTPAQHSELLAALSARYGEVLELPPDSVRAYVTLHRPEHWATGGMPATGRSAPYFTATVVDGGPVERRRRLLGAFTDVIIDVLGVDRRLVLGRIVPLHPDDWAVGGVPAGSARGGSPARG